MDSSFVLRDVGSGLSNHRRASGTIGCDAGERPLARRAGTVERVANLCAYRMGWTLNPRENKMNVGKPQRVIEVVPLHEPVPSEPKPVEPEKEPVYEPEKEPVEP